MRLPAFPFLELSVFLVGTLTCSCRSGDQSWRSEVAEGWTTSSYRLSQNETERLKREARRARQDGNREVCGAILQSSDGSLKLCFADNESLHAHAYQLSDTSVRRVERIAKSSNSAIIGSFHSHPSSDAQPGAGDLEHAGVHSLMLIHSVRTGRTRLWKVVLREGQRKAREVELRVFGRRPRGPSPLPPSKSVKGSPALDVRTP